MRRAVVAWDGGLGGGAFFGGGGLPAVVAALLLDEDPESDEDPYAAAGNGPRAQTLKSLLRVAQRQRDGPPFQTCSLFRTHPISRRAVTLRPELCRLIEEFAGPRLTYANLAAIEWDRRLMKYAKTKMARELARDCGEQSLAEGMLVIAEIIFMDFDEEKRRKHKSRSEREAELYAAKLQKAENEEAERFLRDELAYMKTRREEDQRPVADVKAELSRERESVSQLNATVSRVAHNATARNSQDRFAKNSIKKLVTTCWCSAYRVGSSRNIELHTVRSTALNTR